MILSEIMEFSNKQFEDLESDTIQLMRKKLKPEQL